MNFPDSNRILGTSPSPLAFCPQLEKLLASRRLVGKSGKEFQQLGSCSTINNLITLRNLFLTLKPARTLEIGLAFGASALLFTASHAGLGRPPLRQHLAIDPFQSEGWDGCGLLVQESAGLAGYLDFRENLSSSELPKVLEEKVSFGMVYIDGSHLFEDVFVDFYHVARMVEAGGIVAFDDSSELQVKKVQRFINANMQDSWEPVNLEPYRADLGKSVRYRLGKIFGTLQLVAYKKIGSGQRRADSFFQNF